jgi:hypothetical protein
MGMTTKRIIEIFNDYDRISGVILRGNSEEETKFNCETIEALQSINVSAMGNVDVQSQAGMITLGPNPAKTPVCNLTNCCICGAPHQIGNTKVFV